MFYKFKKNIFHINENKKIKNYDERWASVRKNQTKGTFFPAPPGPPPPSP